MMYNKCKKCKYLAHPRMINKESWCMRKNDFIFTEDQIDCDLFKVKEK